MSIRMFTVYCIVMTEDFFGSTQFLCGKMYRDQYLCVYGTSYVSKLQFSTQY